MQAYELTTSVLPGTATALEKDYNAETELCLGSAVEQPKPSPNGYRWRANPSEKRSATKSENRVSTRKLCWQHIRRGERPECYGEKTRGTMLNRQLTFGLTATIVHPSAHSYYDTSRYLNRLAQKILSKYSPLAYVGVRRSQLAPRRSFSDG